jgi:alkylhydroperoxidase family enzyme
LGIPESKLLDLADWRASGLFDSRERVALEYADAMTLTGLGPGADLFTRLQGLFTDDEIVELTMLIAWENASSKFNRALRIGSQGLWKRASR